MFGHLARYEWVIIELVVVAALVWELLSLRRANRRAAEQERLTDGKGKS